MISLVQSSRNDVSLFHGAIAICLLTVLYALLGTFVYLQRPFEEN